MAVIKPLSGDNFGIFKNSHYVVVQSSTRDEKDKVVFSFCQQGKAIVMHFATNKKGLRHLKPAIGEFINWAILSMPWCKMIIGVIERKSVERLALKFGFRAIHSQEGKTAYMRLI